jgi:G3E family GTPase
MTQKLIPVTILTGFLGAGKTTLLNRIIHGEHGQRVAVLVNDFGSINIDSQLVVDVDGDMVSLSNGCICCTIRGDFVAAVEQVANRDDPPEYIVVEASGVADPIDIGLTFKSIPNVVIDSILAVIDAEQIQSLEREFAVLAMNQIGVADIVILNKVDLVNDDELEAVRGYIRKIIKDARVFETRFAEVPLELILNVGEYAVERLSERPAQDVHVHEAGIETDHDHDHADVFSTWSWSSLEPVSLRAVKRAMEALPRTVYRAKGIFHTADDPANRMLVQVVGRRVTIQVGQPWENRPPSSQFVLIAEHDRIAPADLQTQMDATLQANNPGSPLERVARGIISWLRS